MAVRQLYFLNRIESFFYVCPRILTGLENWISNHLTGLVNSTAGKWDSAALDVLEWIPLESKVSAFSLHTMVFDVMIYAYMLCQRESTIFTIV